MPKVKETVNTKLSGWIKGKDKVFSIDGKGIFCRCCCKFLSVGQKTHLQQHESSVKHLENLRKSSRFTQISENSGENLRSNFSLDLCGAMVAANIPWAKLDCPQFKEFLTKYCKLEIPNRTTLSKNYLPKYYDKTIQEIQKYIGDYSIWICVDETTDVCGRYIANLVLGKLSDEEPSIPYLISSKVLDKTNHATVARFINDSLSILWPTNIQHSKVKILYSDSAAYMLKCAVTLKVFYPNLIHFTCLAHALNRICEVIRNEYDLVDGLISNTKKVFLKAPTRVQRYRELLPETPLPPEPILTRWGTWLNAALIYSENFDGIKEVVMDFDDDSAISIKKAKQFFLNPNIKSQLVYIATNFKILADTITKLEAVGLPLTKSIDLFNNVKTALESCPGPMGEVVRKKIKQVLDRNPGYERINSLCKIFLGEKISLPEGISVGDAPYYKYIPVTSCDVERSFSQYKHILSDRRHNLDPQNIEKMLVCYSAAKQF